MVLVLVTAGTGSAGGDGASILLITPCAASTFKCAPRPWGSSSQSQAGSTVRSGPHRRRAAAQADRGLAPRTKQAEDPGHRFGYGKYLVGKR